MDERDQTLIAGTTIARRGRAVIIRGPSGSGKSDLALRALTTPLRLPGEADAVTFDLVSDDQTVIERVEGRLMARAPETIAEMIEVRGLGIVRWPAIAAGELVLAADVVAAGCGEIERLPGGEAARWRLLGVEIGRVDIAAREASAVHKLAIALRAGEDWLAGR